MMDVLHVQSVSEHSSLDHVNSKETLRESSCHRVSFCTFLLSALFSTVLINSD